MKKEANKKFSCNSFRSDHHKEKKLIQYYLYKKSHKILKNKDKVSIFLNNDTKINDNSTKITVNNDLIKSKISESNNSIEFYYKSKLFKRKNNISDYKDKSNNLRDILYSPEINNNNKIKSEPNDNNASFDISNNKSMKAYLLTKYQLSSSIPDKKNKNNIVKIQKRKSIFNIIKNNKLRNNYLSLKDIQRYNDFIKFKTLKKNFMKNKRDNLENLNDLSFNNRSRLEFMKDVNGIYRLPKIKYSKYDTIRKKYMQLNLNKVKNIKHNSYANLHKSMDNIKVKFNEENKEMNNTINNIYSKFDVLKKEYNLKISDKNSKKGLEDLYYLYNKKRVKEENIVTNRIIEDNNWIYNFNTEKKQIKNYNDLSQDDIILVGQKKINKLFHDLLIFQLPKLTEKKYARKILYDIFIEFKNMLLLSMVINKDINIDKKGIDFDTFFNCNIKVNHQGKILAKKLFEVFNKKSGTKYMKINNYLKAMIKMKDSNKENKLDLFFKILDSNSDGYLTYDEINKLSIICLQKIALNIEEEFEEFEKIKKQNNINQDMQIVEVLADYFCKMIFKLVKIDINEKIPLKTLKEMIMKGGEEADYIELLFGSSNFV